MYQCKGLVDNNEYNSSRDGIQIVHAHTSMHICVCVNNYVCIVCVYVCYIWTTFQQPFAAAEHTWLSYLEPEYHKCNSEKCEARTE